MTNATGGFVTNLFNLNNIFSLEARGLDGDDLFQINGTLAALTVACDNRWWAILRLATCQSEWRHRSCRYRFVRSFDRIGYDGHRLWGCGNVDWCRSSQLERQQQCGDRSRYEPDGLTGLYSDQCYFGHVYQCGIEHAVQLGNATSSTIDLAAGDDTLTVRGTTQGERPSQ